jgi:hypothetical protein
MKKHPKIMKLVSVVNIELKIRLRSKMEKKKNTSKKVELKQMK